MPRLSSLLLPLALGALAHGATNSTYDYIIAGGGVAGIIVAERIAESGASVLLLERGNASTYASGGRDTLPWNNTVTQYDVPGLRHYIKKNFNDTSEYCPDTADSSGCILGGGSMVNQFVFVHPQDVDFDDKWPVGWKSSDVASATSRAFSRNPGTITPSTDGLRYDQSSYSAFSTWFAGHGWSTVDPIENPNDKTAVYSYPPWNIQDGVAAGPVKTYLPLAQALSNFELQLRTKVIRVVRDGTLISGVEVQTNDGQRQIINLNHGGRVILASGSLSTPRILFNSGIGPTAQIETVASGNSTTNVTLPAESDWINLPVGQSLMDHPIVTINFNTTSAVLFLATSAFTAPNATNVNLYAQGSGVLAQAYQRLIFWTHNVTSDGNARYFQGTCYASANNVVSIKVYLTHGLTSSGVLGITAAGKTYYEAQPYLTTTADQIAIGDFIDNLIAWGRQPNSSLVYAGPPSDTGAKLISNSSNISSGNHWVGTAKMGTDDGRINNGTAVVDLNTKVYGTDNLFVVDGSIHPDLPTGNLQAIVMVVAEAAAAKILALKQTTSSVVSSSSASESYSYVSTSTAVVVGGQSSAASSSSAVSSASAVLSSSVASSSAAAFSSSVALSSATSPHTSSASSVHPSSSASSLHFSLPALSTIKFSSTHISLPALSTYKPSLTSSLHISLSAFTPITLATSTIKHQASIVKSSPTSSAKSSVKTSSSSKHTTTTSSKHTTSTSTKHTTTTSSKHTTTSTKTPVGKAKTSSSRTTSTSSTRRA